MAEFPTKRIVNLDEQSAPQSGDYIVTDNQTNGTKKTPASALATSQALAAEVTARQQADEAEQTAREEADDALTESVTALSDEVTAQGALIQNPTKTVSGNIAHFTDGAEMPAKSVIVNIEPQQSGTGTPSPDNVRQISGWESVVLTVEGKNVFSGTTKNNKNLNGSGNEETDYLRSCTTAINVDAGKAYTISYTENVDCAVFYYDKNNIFLSLQGWAANPRTFTPPENTAFVRFSFKQGTAPTNIQVEVGNTATTYEPYTGTTTTTDLGRTVYGGTLDVVSGVLTVDKKAITINGTEGYAYNVNYQGTRLFDEIMNSKKAPVNDFIANNMIGATARGSTGVLPCIKTYSAASGIDAKYMFVCPPDTVTDTASMNAWFADNPTTVVYPIEPQTYQLTPTEVTTLLGENNVWADAGAVEVTYRRDINLALEQLEALLNS